MKTGFIGLGTMGLPMAKNLAEAGFQLNAFDPNIPPGRLLEQIPGSQAFSSVKEVAQTSEVIFTCLPNDTVVREVYLGAEGILNHAGNKLSCSDTSTISPELAVELSKNLSRKEISFLQAPMLGSQPQAVEGTLFFIVSGDENTHQRFSPLLDIMGRLQMFVGGPGLANRIKLIHNALGAVNSVAVAESLALCVETGVDPQIFCNVVNNGGGMAWSTYFERRAERVSKGNFDPTFSLDLMLKDVTMAFELATRAGVPVPIMEETLSTYQKANQSDLGGLDFSAVSRVVENRLGKKLFGKDGKD